MTKIASSPGGKAWLGCGKAEGSRGMGTLDVGKTGRFNKTCNSEF